jgi:hypothetical protein
MAGFRIGGPVAFTYISTTSVKKTVALVRKRTIPTERSQLVGEVSANFSDRGCRVVSATDPHGRILDRSRYYFSQVAPQLYSRGWVDPVSDPLLLRKSGSAGNRTRDLWICNQDFWSLDHSGGRLIIYVMFRLFGHPHACPSCISSIARPLYCPVVVVGIFCVVRLVHWV